MFKGRIFAAWFAAALAVWLGLFVAFDSVPFLLGHWYYPATMVAGAFVAGFTPEGGGAVAFPVLNVFLHIDRVLARDFSMMIQSAGMTSATIWILTQPDTRRADYRPLFVLVPVCFVGTVFGFVFLQQIPVFVIQAMFLCLSATFVIAYYASNHRGTLTVLVMRNRLDWWLFGAVLVVGGMVSSLFGTGGDVLVYTLLVTRFNMLPKIAVRMSIVLQAAISVLGFTYRARIDHGLTDYQIRTWLCAVPVVLFMAPFGAYVLAKLHVNWMLKAIIALNCFQLLYYNLNEPTRGKLVATVICTAAFSAIFFPALRHMSRRNLTAVEA